MEIESEIRNFGGTIYKVKHASSELKADMRFNVFLPKEAVGGKPASLPLILFLGGLTTTQDSGLEKGHFTAAAAKYGVGFLFPDSSPRGTNTPGEDDDWDFGTGAGFYLDATREPWSKHYRMESYITKELLPLVTTYWKPLDSKRVGITGYSMGGHGALTLWLRHPDLFSSVSAFAPIANPIEAPWGKKAFQGYLGENDGKNWAAQDATEIIKHWTGALPNGKILVDQGSADNFYDEQQLLPEHLERAVEQSPFKGRLTLRMHEGHNHSFFFVSTFAEDHVRHHTETLRKV